MSREYIQHALLQGAHRGAITAVAIRPGDSRVATASLDGDVCIWEISSQKVLYAYRGGMPVLALRWDDRGEHRLLCGMDNGYVASLEITAQDKIEASGFIGHSHPVDCLDIFDEYIATGASNEMRVWGWRARGMFYIHSAELAEPQVERHSQRHVVVTSLRWTRGRALGNLLWMGECAYSGSSEHPLIVSGSARADFSEDGLKMIVSNALTGFDLYAMPSGSLLRAFGQDVGLKRATPVRFIEQDYAIVGGTTIGEVCIWHRASGRKLQTLLHSGALSISSTYPESFSVLRYLQILESYSLLM
ncbi:WD40 repeat-like protein [Pilatotrama ljubarskyi]|nr:WD40 repeat-like protein [Pilatotrama ljubarskyi]